MKVNIKVNMKAFFALVVCFVFLQDSYAAVYQVGPGRTYVNLQAVTALLQPGDIVEVDGNVTYPGDVRFTNPGTPAAKITIRGIRVNGNRPVISGGTNTVSFVTDWPYSGPGGDHYIFEGFEVTGGTSRGIYHQADDLTVSDVAVHDCPAHGILGADQGSGSLTLQYVEVYRCGDGTYRHQIYMATDEVHYPGSVFRMEHCYIHDGNGGNNVKTRAERNEIYYNWIEGAYYHELELIGPDGGDGGNPALKREDSDVVGNVFWSKNDFYLTRVGGDGTGETNGRYRFVNNTFICMSWAAFRVHDGIESIEIHNNAFYRHGSEYVEIMRTSEADWATGSEVISGSRNWVNQDPGAADIPSQWTGTVFGTDPGFTDFSTGDLRPATGSSLCNGGTDSPVSPTGYPFTSPLFPPAMHPPLHTVETPGEASARPTAAPIDIGAYEYPANGTNPDFNSDGNVDILWRNKNSGQNVAWNMNGIIRTGSTSLPASGNTNWQIAGTGDFNNDGKTDILWRNTNDGNNVVWYMDGVQRTGYTYFDRIADLNWRIAGTGDFNDDGKTDILWRHYDSGSNVVWFMDGVQRTGFKLVPRVSDCNWRIVATGDFNDDNRPDILWRNYSTGNVVVWFMEGTVNTGFASLPGVSDLDWKIDGTGDFNGNGNTDILWRHYSNGKNVVWYLDGVTYTGFVSLPAVSDLNWEICNNGEKFNTSANAVTTYAAGNSETNETTVPEITETDESTETGIYDMLKKNDNGTKEEIR